MEPGRNGEADAVDGARVAEILDEIDRFDGQPASSLHCWKPVEALKFLRKTGAEQCRERAVIKGQNLEEAIRPKPAGSASSRAGSRARTPPTRPGSSSSAGSRRVITGRWAGWRSARTIACQPAGAVARGEVRDRARHELCAGYRSAGARGASGARPDLGLCAGRRLSQDGKEGAEGARPLRRRAGRRPS